MFLGILNFLTSLSGYFFFSEKTNKADKLICPHLVSLGLHRFREVLGANPVPVGSRKPNQSIARTEKIS